MFLFSSGTTTPETGNPQQFNAYWNVPSFVCHKYGVKFEDLENFGIRQNTDDEFRGEVIAILYDPGMFPALLTDKNGKSRIYIFFCRIKLLQYIYMFIKETFSFRPKASDIFFKDFFIVFIILPYYFVDTVFE